MKRIILILLILGVLLTGCTQNAVKSDDDIGIEEVEEEEISQELGQDIEDIETLNESEFGLGEEFEDFESDLEDFEW
jgi:PBP1b-binding outer membrane lipoprotein LpoB